MSKLKGVIFDLDGTLINSLEAYTKAFNFGVQKFGSRPASKRELRDFLDKGYSLEDILQKLYPDFESKEKRQRCVNEIRNAYLGIEKEVGLIHRAAEVLSSLKKRGLKIGIVTGRMIHGEMKWLELRRLEIASFIDAMVTGAEALRKPFLMGL